MVASLVTDPEFLWIVDSLEEHSRSVEVTNRVPIDQNAVYLRLRRLKENGHLDAEKQYGAFYWELTERGEETLADFDFPPADETDFEEYFAGRSKRLDPNRVLQTIAREDDEWVPTSTLFEHIDFAKNTVRNHLNDLKADGLVEEDDCQKTHKWRVTEAGYEQLADADETLTNEDGTYIWGEANQSDAERLDRDGQ